MSKRKPIRKFKLKKDMYKKRRIGLSFFLNIFCSACDTWVLLYQKDGRGNLLRFYLNRIFAPTHLSELQDKGFQRPQDMKKLTCPQCGKLIGTPMRHLDDRLAYRLQRNSFSKEKSDGTYHTETPSETKEKE